MKNVNIMKSVSTNIRNIVSVVLIALFTIVSTASFANNNDKKAKDAKSIPTEVKYLYSVEGNDVIQINIDNANAEDLTITITDADGEELYSEIFSDKKISKKFLMNTADFTTRKVTFTVSSKKGGINQTMLISKESLIAKN